MDRKGPESRLRMTSLANNQARGAMPLQKSEAVMNALVDELKSDHERFRRYVSAFERETTLLANGELSDYSLIQQLAEFFSALPDEAHHKIEDIIYVQLAERLADDMSGQGDNLHELFDLCSDHQDMAAFAETFREGVAQMLSGAELPRAELAELSVQYIQHFRTHMFNEELHFFPLISEFLTSDDWEQIDSKIEAVMGDARLSGKVSDVEALESSLLAHLQSSH